MEKAKKLAMLIDADNMSAAQAGFIMQKVSQYGKITLKRAYGNWRKPALAIWVNTLEQYAIKAVQQFDYVPGKNTTDIALIIDAMCLLQSGIYDGFALVSSDSDFTPLAIHMREAGVFVMGIGEKKTPEAFRHSCDEFIILPKDPAPLPATQNNACSPEKKSSSAEIAEIHRLLQKTSEKNRSAEGYTYVSLAGDAIKSAVLGFNPKTYGYSSLHRLMEAFPHKYEVKRHGTVYSYRCIEEKEQTPLLDQRTLAHRQAISDYLSTHGTAQRKDLEKILSLHSSRTREILRSMIADGMILAEGSNKNRSYKRSDRSGRDA